MKGYAGGTFGQLISIVGDGVGWATFRRLHDSGSNPIGSEAVASVYVHMEDLADVDAAGRALEEAGYSTSYLTLLLEMDRQFDQRVEHDRPGMAMTGSESASLDGVWWWTT